MTVECPQVNRIDRPARRAAHPQIPIARGDGGANCGGEQDRHALFLTLVPRGNQALGVLNDLRIRRTSHCPVNPFRQRNDRPFTGWVQSAFAAASRVHPHIPRNKIVGQFGPARARLVQKKTTTIAVDADRHRRANGQTRARVLRKLWSSLPRAAQSAGLIAESENGLIGGC
jgi:hypothetical protein